MYTYNPSGYFRRISQAKFLECLGSLSLLCIEAASFYEAIFHSYQLDIAQIYISCYAYILLYIYIYIYIRLSVCVCVSMCRIVKIHVLTVWLWPLSVCLIDYNNIPNQ